jgi:hypothetical protein
LPNPTELQSCRPSGSAVLHAGCAIFVNEQLEVRTHFLVEIALDGAMTRHVAEQRRKEAHG